MINVLIGTISGIVSSMGMGGGTILILFLTLILGKEQHIAQGANLMFFIPTAIISIILHARNNYIKWREGAIVLIFGALGAVVGSKISISLNTNKLKICFGIFLLFIAFFEIYNYFIRKEK